MRRLISTRTRRAAVVLGLAIALGPGCGIRPKPLDAEGQAIADDAQGTEGNIELAAEISALPTLTLTKAQVTLASVVKAQTGATKLFSPEGCATVSVEGNVVTYAFASCHGPWGAAELSGEEHVTFAPGDAPGDLLVDMASDGLTLSGSPLSHDASARITFDATGKAVRWTGELSGTTPKKKPFALTNDLAAHVGDDGCASLSGTTQAKLGLRSFDLAFDDVSRCGPVGTCPYGSVTATAALTHLSVTLTFDGTTTLVASTDDGASVEIPFECTPPTAKDPSGTSSP